jgi:transcriptional regulator with GAF, ATPase, and Fis domain
MVDMRSAHDILDAQTIRAALERNNFNRLAAARELGIHKTTLFRRMKKLGITPPPKDGRNRSHREK